MNNEAHWPTQTELLGKTVFSVSPSSCGKTTLSQILASFRGVNHLDEFWPLIAAVAMNSVHNLEYEPLKDYLRSTIVETNLDQTLLRQANFRPRDESSIWKTKPVREIYQRLVKLRSRQQASEDLAGVNTHLVLGVTEGLHSFRFLHKIAPEAQAIVIIRHPLDVAISVARRGWLNDSFLREPRDNMPYRLWRVRQNGLRNTETQWRNLPWWLSPKRFESFLAGDPITRGLIYWESFFLEGVGLHGFRDAGGLILRLEDLLYRPLSAVKSLPFMAGKDPTPKTRALINNLYVPEVEDISLPSAAETKLSELLPKIESLELTSFYRLT